MIYYVIKFPAYLFLLQPLHLECLPVNLRYPPLQLLLLQHLLEVEHGTLVVVQLGPVAVDLVHEGDGVQGATVVTAVETLAVPRNLKKMNNQARISANILTNEN